MEWPPKPYDPEPIFVTPPAECSAIAERILAAGKPPVAILTPEIKTEPEPQSDEEKLNVLVQRYRDMGFYAPGTSRNPLRRELTDAEIRAKILASKETWERAQHKRARKMARRLSVSS